MTLSTHAPASVAALSRARAWPPLSRGHDLAVTISPAVGGISRVFVAGKRHVATPRNYRLRISGVGSNAKWVRALA